MPNAISPQKIPLPVEEGGTNATDAATARTNLGTLANAGDINGAQSQAQTFLEGVIVGDGSKADVGVQIISTATGEARVFFGNGVEPAFGRIIWDNNTDSFVLYVKNTINPAVINEFGLTVRGRMLITVAGGSSENGQVGHYTGGGDGVFIAKTAGGTHTPGDGQVILQSGKMVLEATAIWLDGQIRTQDNHIIVTDNLDRIIGAIGRTDPDGHLFIGRMADEDAYDPNDGGILMGFGGVSVLGAGTSIESLSNTDGENNQVYANEDGILYTVAPPAPGWEVVDTDAGDYDLGSGTGIGAWVQFTGLETAVSQDVAAGDRINITANIYVVNKSATRGGTIDVGFGINNVNPTDGQNFSIPGGFAGYIVVSFASTTHGGLTAGDTIDLAARRFNGTHIDFGVDLMGSVSLHEQTIGVPGDSGATVDAVLVNRTDHGVGDLKAAVVSSLPGTPAADTLYFVTT